MADARLQVLIEAADKYSAEFRRAKGQFDDLAKTARRAGLVLSAFGAGGVLAFRSFANAALEQQRAMRSLAAVVENSGITFDSVRGKIESVTTALARKTAIGDEEQMRVLGLMVPILGDVDKALAALPAVLDLSATSGRDLAMTARTLSSALAGNMDSSSQLGLKFKETAGFGERLSEVLAKVQGAAKANADPFNRLSDSMGELKERMGDAVLPLVKPFIDFLTDTTNKLQELDPRLFKVAAGFGLTATALASLSGPALMVATALPGLVTGFKALAAINFTLLAASIGAVSLALAPYVLIAAGVAAIGVGTYLTVKELGKAFQETTGGIEQIINPLENTKRLLFEWRKAARSVGLAIRELADDFDILHGAIDEANSRFTTSQTLFSQMMGQLQKLGRDTARWWAEVDKLVAMGLNLQAAMQVVAIVIRDDLNAELEVMADWAANGEEKLRQLRDAGIDLADIFTILAGLPLEVRFKDIGDEAEETRKKIEKMMLAIDQAVRAQQRPTAATLEQQIELYKGAIEAAQQAGDFWRINELTVALRNLENQLIQARTAENTRLALGLVGTIAAGTGEMAEWARAQIQQAFPIGAFPVLPGVPTPMQQGGIVMRPTMALLGERGPEAVLPLSALDKLGERLALAISQASNMPVTVMLDGRVLAVVMGRRAEIREQARY